MRRSFVPPSECLDIFRRLKQAPLTTCLALFICFFYVVESFCSTLIDGIASSPCLYAVDPYASPLLQVSEPTYNVFENRMIFVLFSVDFRFVSNAVRTFPRYDIMWVDVNCISRLFI